ncbi:MAG: glycerol kinase GlpK [Lachnospiraceae bacterium]|nr:glycerol kinase GlpK [Lachnospiraceae bacterium]
MRGKYIMALDQGTTSSRCVIIDKSGTIRSMAQRELKQIYPFPGWVEHDPVEIWSSQLGVAAKAMAKLGIRAEEIASLGITNQRETTIIWNKHTGKPVYNAIVWQCHRTADQIEEIKISGFDQVMREKTGLIPDAYFSATKISWILDHVEGARKEAEAGNLLFGTVDSWLIWNLSKGSIHITDYTNASRTMLFDIRKLSWDDEILEYFHIPKAMLPQVKPSSCLYGYTDSNLLGGEIAISGVAGDQQAALFGQLGFDKGDVKNTYGTGCFLLMNTGQEVIRSKHGLLTTIAAGDGTEVNYALEGSIFAAGAVIQWLRDELHMVEDAAQAQYCAECVQDTSGVYIVPAFTGLGAPYWKQYARGTVVGITRGCNKEHFIRAAMESIAYQTHDVLRAMEEDADLRLNSLKVDGGASVNDFLMQFQADILHTQVRRPECTETTVLGAAYLAGLAVGYWRDREEIKEYWKLSREFHPQMMEEHANKLLRGWEKAVRCALVWQEGEH